MSMGEIAYEIREHVDILIGAEGLEPEFGWPYRRILAGVRALPPHEEQVHMLPKELARVDRRRVRQALLGLRRSVGRSTDLAAMDLAQTDRLADAFAGLVAALRKLTRGRP